MNHDPNQEARLFELRIEELEAELARTRRRLATKEREVLDIHRSRAWGLISALRAMKYRFVDPPLGILGISWPRRRAPAAPLADVDSATLVEPARAGTYDVICFSTCDWDSRFQRPQQLMSLYADAGHRVFYVSQQFRDDGPAWMATRKRANVYEVTFRGEALNVYTERPGDRAMQQLFDGLVAMRCEASIADAALILQLPFWWPLAQRTRHQFGWPVLYDCMDHHAGFSTVRRTMVRLEEELLREADVVIASSAMLHEKAKEARGSNRVDDVLLLRNGCDYEHFARTPRARNARPVIGYYGAIADWFDSALVADLATRRPDWDFVLVGSTYGADISRLVALANVELPGEEPYESLPEWLGRFDAAIIPFKRCSLTEATNPVKMYEMLAGGRAIVAVPIPEVAMLAPVVRLAATAEEFERELLAALAEDEAAADARRAFAREQTWQRRFDELAAAAAVAVAKAPRAIFRAAP